MGGVNPAAARSAPDLSTVLQQLQQLAAGQLLLGHGIAKDLTALGWDHPEGHRFDTMTHAAFCNKAGISKNLKQLAKEFLSADIQQGPQAAQQRGGMPSRGGKKQQQQQGPPAMVSRSGHDPEEDAVAVMQLYQQVRMHTGTTVV